MMFGKKDIVIAIVIVCTAINLIALSDGISTKIINHKKAVARKKCYDYLMEAFNNQDSMIQTKCYDSVDYYRKKALKSYDLAEIENNK